MDVTGLSYNGAGQVVAINGIATNKSGRDLQTCMITFDLLNSSGVKVGEAVASTLNLRDGQQWQFQAFVGGVFGVPISSVQPGSVTAF